MLNLGSDKLTCMGCDRTPRRIFVWAIMIDDRRFWFLPDRPDGVLCPRCEKARRASLMGRSVSEPILN